jgi:putative flippase GtrA
LPFFKTVLKAIRHIVLGVIDFFHKPFRNVIGKQTFRYLACGGSNTLADIFIYTFSYHYILHKLPVHIGGITIASHIFAFIISFSISFPTGFVLSKYIVFPESEMKGRVQLFRYLVLVCACIVLKYLFLKLFIEVCGIYPTPANIITTALIAVFSYVSQRKFTFKVKTITVEPDPVPVNETVNN